MICTKLYNVYYIFILPCLQKIIAFCFGTHLGWIEMKYKCSEGGNSYKNNPAFGCKAAPTKYSVCL